MKKLTTALISLASVCTFTFSANAEESLTPYNHDSVDSYSEQVENADHDNGAGAFLSPLEKEAISMNCTVYTKSPTYNFPWTVDNSVKTDNQILGADIQWYQIRWFNGKWSGVYIPGNRDFDTTSNSDGSQRRVWAYFYDHTHQYCM